VKILVVSDTHGAIFESIVKPMQDEKNIDLMIHCGDNYRDAEKLSELLGVKEYYRVPGNCDFNLHNESNLLCLKIGGKHVIITHGHLQHVKDGLDELKGVAKEKNADIVLYGHTHIAHEEIHNNVLFFNPGSTIMPKYGNPSYGIIEIKSDNVLSKILNI
jgi:putative phosphoesterase